DIGHGLEGGSRLNRLELGKNRQSRCHKISNDPAKVEAHLLRCGVRSLPKNTREVVLDFDATDDPLHGKQEGRFFHGYYRDYCYLPLYIFAGDVLLAAKLRRADGDGAAGAVEEVARIVGQVRRRWPGVRIGVRGDSGVARGALMTWCEAHEVDYVVGLARNARVGA